MTECPDNCTSPDCDLVTGEVEVTMWITLNPRTSEEKDDSLSSYRDFESLSGEEALNHAREVWNGSLVFTEDNTDLAVAWQIWLHYCLEQINADYYPPAGELESLLFVFQKTNWMVGPKVDE